MGNEKQSDGRRALSEILHEEAEKRLREKFRFGPNEAYAIVSEVLQTPGLVRAAAEDGARALQLIASALSEEEVRQLGKDWVVPESTREPGWADRCGPKGSPDEHPCYSFSCEAFNVNAQTIAKATGPDARYLVRRVLLGQSLHVRAHFIVETYGDVIQRYPAREWLSDGAKSLQGVAR